MAANDTQDMSVMSSLFGLDPDVLAAQRRAQGAAVDRAHAQQQATMTPQSMLGAIQLEGGAQVGRALAPEVQSLLGVQQPADPQMRLAQTMKSIMGDLSNSGVDMSDPVATQSMVGQKLVQAGFPQQGMMALENSRLAAQQQQLAQAKAAKDAADAEKFRGEAAKAFSESDPAAMALRNGHVTPASFAAYIQGGKDPSLLQPTDKYTIANTAEGVYAVSKTNPAGDKTYLGSNPSVVNNQNTVAARLSVAGVGPNGKIAPDEAMAKSIQAGNMPAFQGWALRDPRNRATMDRVLEMDPNYTAAKFMGQAAATKAWSVGSPMANTTRSLNVVQQHLDVMNDLVDALKNGNTQALNAVNNTLATWEGKPQVTNFKAGAQIVAKEVSKALAASGNTSMTERQELEHTLSNAASPAQLHEAISTWRMLIGGQLNGLAQQYKAGTGLDNFETHVLGRPDVQGQTPTGGDVVAAGRAAFRQGRDAYNQWWSTLTLDQQNSYKAAVAAMKR